MKKKLKKIIDNITEYDIISLCELRNAVVEELKRRDSEQKEGITLEAALSMSDVLNTHIDELKSKARKRELWKAQFNNALEKDRSYRESIEYDHQ